MEKKEDIVNWAFSKNLSVYECILPNSSALSCSKPQSFADPTDPPDKSCPIPRPIPLKMIMAPLPTTRQEILHGLVRPKVGGLVCTDKKALAKQSGILTDIIKSTMVAVMAGQALASISLPVRVFEPRSSIQRIVDMWSSAPIYLTRAAKQ